MILSGTEIYVGDDKGMAYVLNAETLEPISADGKLIEVNSEYKKPITSLAASPSMLAIGSKDGLITIYDLATRTKKAYFKGHNSVVSHM